MKLAIYGDSFADPSWTNNDYLAWPELLSNDFQVTNFAKSGSSLWWSYQQFKQNKDNFDYNIFVGTIYGRYYLEGLDKHLNINDNSWPKVNGVDLGQLYYQHFFSESREIAFNNFMIVDIMASAEVYIPSFTESSLNGEWSLNHFSNLEYEHYGVLSFSGVENRKCHLSKEHNNMIYDKIKSAIVNNNTTLGLTESDAIPPQDPFNYYFNKL